jgi:type I restriction enzyme S subunit
MREDWDFKPLSDLCAVFTDGDWVESKDQSPQGIRLVQTGNIGEGIFKNRSEKARYISSETFDRLRCTEIIQGDCLVSRLPDPVGACVLPATGERMITAVDCTIIRFKKEILIPRYFVYYSQSPEYLQAVASECTGTTRNRISRNNLGLTPIPVPPLPEQQRIVALLDEAFAGLATAKANAERNLQNARAIFESHLESVFSKRGEGWVDPGECLSDLCELIVDCEHKTAPVQEDGIPSIRTPNIGKGRLLMDNVNRVSEETYAQWTRRAEPKGGDLILAREAPAGNVAVIPDGSRVCLGQRTVLIRPKAEFLDNSFLAFLILEPKTQSMLLEHSRGATVRHVNMKDIRALSVGPIPCLDDQRSIVSALWKLDAETHHLTHIYERKLAALEELKQSLLQQAFNGEL